MAQRATSRGPQPSLFVLVCFFLFCFFSCVFVFLFEGFKGQVRWPKGPPHLALNPPYFFALFLCFCVFVLFPFFGKKTKTVFLYKNMSLSLSLSLLLFSLFLLCLFCFFLLCVLLLPCFCLFLSLLCFFAFVS